MTLRGANLTDGHELSEADAQLALDNAVAAVRAMMSTFGRLYPDDTTVDGRYQLRPARRGMSPGANLGWTTGFVPGMQWIAAAATGDPTFAEEAQRHTRDFDRRIRAGEDVDHHDMGFLYQLSCVSAWTLRRDPIGRAAGLLAADRLMKRFVQPAGIFQAWGALSDPAQAGRTIIDSLMNMPLLIWASTVSGIGDYRHAAGRHVKQLARHIVRADDSTYHTFHWDPRTGIPMGGTTAQGAGDDSCWARGQAWAVYGFALGYRTFRDMSLLSVARRCADRLLAQLPDGLVPYWDLDFEEGSSEPRDSSAGAIAVCGLLELAGLEQDPIRSGRYREWAGQMLAALVRDCAPSSPELADALLLHGVYSRPESVGVDEGNLWGDYFYLEALMRTVRPDWRPAW